MAFQRGLREPLFPNGEPGSYDGGMVNPYFMVQKENGDIWIYAGVSTHEHAHIPRDSCAVAVYKLRRDGFAYLETAGGTGILATRALYLEGERFEINLSAVPLRQGEGSGNRPEW